MVNIADGRASFDTGIAIDGQDFSESSKCLADFSEYATKVRGVKIRKYVVVQDEFTYAGDFG